MPNWRNELSMRTTVAGRLPPQFLLDLGAYMQTEAQNLPSGNNFDPEKLFGVLYEMDRLSGIWRNESGAALCGLCHVFRMT